MKKIKFAKVKAALKGKGFIFALALSIAAVGAATYYAYDSVMNGFGEGELTDDGLVMGVDETSRTCQRIQPAKLPPLRRRLQRLLKAPMNRLRKAKLRRQIISLRQKRQELCPLKGK